MDEWRRHPLGGRDAVWDPVDATGAILLDKLL